MKRATTDTVLVGRNALLRECLTRILSPAGFHILASASTIDHLISSSLPQQQPILVIIDVDDDFGAAFAQLKSFKQRYPAGRVVMLAHQRQLNTMVSAFRLGASAYLAKGATCDTLIKSLELVMLGVTFLPPEILRFICHQQDRGCAADHSGNAAHDINVPVPGRNGQASEMIGSGRETNENIPRRVVNLVPLSTQQQLILRCLIHGDSNKSIARKLAISEATAKVHVKSILRKIRVHNRTQAAIWAISAVPLVTSKDDISPETAAVVPARKRGSFGQLAS